MIALTRIRELSIAPAIRSPHLSAASGLVRLGRTIYVVADDELHLGRFSLDDQAPGRVIRLFAGELPDTPTERKRRKPDLECLAVLPPFAGFPHGALWALGSGSTPHRRRGVLLALNAHGEISGQPSSHDLSPLMQALGDAFAEVNVEGAVVTGDELRLFQRGNNSHPDNAIVRFPLAPVLDVLAGRGDEPIGPKSIRRLDLGKIDGIPLCFTDAAALPGGDMVFTAVAEDTDDAYNDGACIGACVGIIDKEGEVRSIELLDHPLKVEGVHATSDGDRLDLLLVTDADDAQIPAALYSAAMEA